MCGGLNLIATAEGLGELRHERWRLSCAEVLLKRTGNRMQPLGVHISASLVPD